MDKQAIAGRYEKCCGGEGTGCHENMWEKCQPQIQKPEAVAPKLGPKGKVGVTQINMRLSQMEECRNGGLIWKHAYVHKLIWNIEGRMIKD